MNEVVSLKDKLGMINEHWHPHIVGELNGQHVKLAKLKGVFVWHHHEHEDELFYVVGGKLKIELRDQDIFLSTGEFYIVPRGVEHRPVAEKEVSVLLFEPAATLNTGNVQDSFTKSTLKKI